jgi:hypothetical protein
MVTKPRQHVAYIILVSAVLFGCSYSAYVIDSVSGANLGISEWLLLVGKTAVELVAASYGIAFLVSALAFLLIREPAACVRQRGSATEPPVGIIYLCYDDADWSALESLTRLSYAGPLFLVIHDDSRNEGAREMVDAMASHLAARRDWDVRVLRRPYKSGGKAGAVNYALDESAYLYKYFLLCDNDSTVLDPDTI